MLKIYRYYFFLCLALTIAGSSCTISSNNEQRDQSPAQAESRSEMGGAPNSGSSIEKNENSGGDKNSPAVSDKPESTVNRQSVKASTINDAELRHLEPFHFSVVKNWLATKPDWRVLGEADYGTRRLESLRALEGNPKAHPFYITGDFNGDGTSEFAVMLISRKNSRVRAVAVFDSSPVTREKFIKPTFFLGDINDNDGSTILHGNKGGIYVGEAGTDSGILLEPSGQTYKVTDPFAEEN